MFKHLDLMEIEGRLDPSRPISARGKTYASTAPGKTDLVLKIIAGILIQIWTKNPSSQVRIADIEANKNLPTNLAYEVPAALKKLARMKQLNLDFDREGVIIKRGSSWIET